MIRLFNLKGKYVGDFVDGNLYLPDGRHVGQYREPENIFVDADGSYLGELYNGDWLVRCPESPWQNAQFPGFERCDRPENVGALDRLGIVPPLGFEDVDLENCE